MKKILLSYLFVFITVLSFAQKRDIPLKEYFADAEFFFVSEEYIDALSDYLEVSKRGYAENANINYKIGICYLYISDQKQKSIDYLLKAATNASNKYTGSTLNEVYAPVDVYLYLGNAYRVNNMIDKAIESYNKYLTLVPEAAKNEINYTQKQIEACNIAMEFINSPLQAKFNNLGALINTNNANYNCVVSADGITMIYMTKLPFYNAVFMSKRRGNNWSRPVNITPQIMSDGDQVITGISNDGNTILLVKEDVFDSEIYISNFEEGQWSKAKPIGKPINSRFYESHASFGKDNNQIYFTSNRAGGIGEMDIYYTEKTQNGTWSEPINLGSAINTELSEDTPFLSGEGNLLYFSSQGHLNMGGYDFFVSSKTDSGWSNPENLKFPLSSTDDDLFYYPGKNRTEGYVQKILIDGYGNWDIYSSEIIKTEEIEEPVALLDTEKIEIKKEEPITQLVKEEIVKEETKVTEAQKTIEFEIKPVLFGFDEYVLTADAKLEIGRYVELLKKDSKLQLVVTGHTDALGPDQYNLLLSEQRALTILNYIKTQGIDASRLKAIGMGEKQFVATNVKSNGSDNSESRKYNRRAEFEIIGFDQSTFMIKRISIVPEQFKITNQ